MSFEQRLVRSIVLGACLALAACSGGGSAGDSAESSQDGSGGSDASGGSGGTGADGTGGSGEAGAGDPGGTGGGDTDAGASGGSAADSGGSAADSGGSTGTGGSDASASSDAGGAGGTSGGSGGAGTSNGTSGSGGVAGSGSGSVPEELVGVWQETRASAGEYTNEFGESFDITSGFSVQLKIASNGAYYFAHLASGAAASCDSVSYFDQSVGVAELEGDTLTLFPDERRLDVTDCEGSESEVLANDAIPLSISLEDSEHYYGGLRTHIMHVDGGPHPLDLTLLHRPPPDDPVQPDQPSDFVLGATGPFADFQGLWVPDTGTDSDFFDPSTGEFYFPELNGSPHQWIRFYGDAYETAVALQNYNAEGACKGDLIYYEQGLGLFQVTEDVGGQGTHFVGHGRLAATAARLIVNVRECDENDGVYEYAVEPLMSYYRFIYFTPDSPPESLFLDCGTFPQSEWQSTLCTTDITYHRRE